MPTVSVENYLKALYHLEREGAERVKTSALADRLELSLPSSTSMLKSLRERGFVDYEPYRGARLTDTGRRHALQVIRNHRLIEAFLVRTLGYTWDEVHDEAEALEHTVSATLIDRIDAFLGFPRFDPHGDPIPTADGSVERRDLSRLADTDPGERVKILRVLDQQDEVLRYLREQGAVVGALLEVIEVQPFDGPVHVRIDGVDRTLGHALASTLLVEPLTDDSAP